MRHAASVSVFLVSLVLPRGLVAQPCSHDCDISIRMQHNGCCPGAAPRPRVRCGPAQHLDQGHCCDPGTDWVPRRASCVCTDLSVCGPRPTPPAPPPSAPAAPEAAPAPESRIVRVRTIDEDRSPIEDATVLLDGAPVGASGVAVAPGEHVVTASAPRHHAARSVIRVRDRVRAEFWFALAALRPAARPSPNGAMPGDRDGDDLLDPEDQCPDAAENYNGFRDGDGCPDDPDTDGDGIPDSRDACTLDAEDLDNYQDDDGCPDLDNDRDGIPDTVDHCRNDAEDHDGYQDSDGCPEPDNDQDGVNDTADPCPELAGPASNQGCPPELHPFARGLLLRPEFSGNTATLRPRGEATLDAVAHWLAAPSRQALRYEVSGHTDHRGPPSQLMRLSASRAAAVRAYLIAHGVVPARLTSRGYGDQEPIESNATEAGREANRRIELHELDANGNVVR